LTFGNEFPDTLLVGCHSSQQISVRKSLLVMHMTRCFTSTCIQYTASVTCPRRVFGWRMQICRVNANTMRMPTRGGPPA